MALQNENIPGGGRYRGKSGKAGFDVGAKVRVVVDPVDIESTDLIFEGPATAF